MFRLQSGIASGANDNAGLGVHSVIEIALDSIHI